MIEISNYDPAQAKRVEFQAGDVKLEIYVDPARFAKEDCGSLKGVSTDQATTKLHDERALECVFTHSRGDKAQIHEVSAKHGAFVYRVSAIFAVQTTPNETLFDHVVESFQFE